MSNKERAVRFLQMAASGQVDEAYTLFIAPQFKHHNSYFKGDTASLKQGMKDSFQMMPHKQFEVLRSLEDGDLVAVHARVRLTPDSPYIALIHVFRFEGSLIAELWEASERAPEQQINEHGQF